MARLFRRDVYGGGRALSNRGRLERGNPTLRPERPWTWVRQNAVRTETGSEAVAVADADGVQALVLPGGARVGNVLVIKRDALVRIEPIAELEIGMEQPLAAERLEVGGRGEGFTVVHGYAQADRE